MTFTMIINAAVIVMGLYIFVSAFHMKFKGKIPNWMFKHIELSKESDENGFIRHMFFKTFYLGFIFVIFGAYGLASDIIITLPQHIGITICFVVMILAYFYILAAAKNKYLGTMK